ncbi:ParA family protein [Paraburkholderia fungorum]|uniref:Chromosome partitioning protein n=1 Tax=Paraburkholderia fungorum TaxID=134537 RepID=A0AAW3V2K0_9BURK|nr:ParA family protein [Paraburkholderia fungorum]MBB4518662.1 chromosome partitioning protein [Paraburkholderia fungorum]MBB6204147.1 chromosome partitioning protein [Paraburkholderia fungorum]
MEAGKIFAVANQKGGSGKTTITLNLAGAYAHDDPALKILVVDADSQNTSVRASGAGEDPYPFTVANLAAAGKGLGREIRRMAQAYDLILVDCPPSVDNPNTENVVAVSDFVLVPMDASVVDAWSTQGMLRLVRRVVGADPSRCGVVFNRVNTKTVAYSEISEAMVEENPYPILKSTIALREVYKTAIGTGTTVFTVKGQRSTKQAREEIMSVAMEMLEIMG